MSTDKNEFRQQLNERYLCGKSLDGANLEEIADGLYDPVKELDYITTAEQQSQSEARRQAGDKSGFGGLVLFALLALLVLAIVFRSLF